MDLTVAVETVIAAVAETMLDEVGVKMMDAPPLWRIGQFLYQETKESKMNFLVRQA